MIPVTKTFLPPKHEYEKKIEQIWTSNQIANGGDLHKELIKKLQDYLGVENIILTANGTLPLQLAIKSLAKTGEIITTPFSYVATTSSIVWENCKPIFVDIDREYLTIDESCIEDTITEKTTAILATHVFGNPCNIEVIEKVAERNNLKVIYDAAHAFGVKYKGISIFEYGHASTCSFHATKLFHTGEGGALFTNDDSLFNELFNMHNFGHDGALTINSLGINAKMNELQAAMGLTVFPYLEQIIKHRSKVAQCYDECLNFEKLRKIKLRDEATSNFSYYPVIFDSEKTLKKVLKNLNENGVFPRRYFYPSLNMLPYVENRPMPVSEKISSCILCLPIYYGIDFKVIEEISAMINKILRN